MVRILLKRHRPEVFEDEDLDSIRDTEEFHLYMRASDIRYKEAMKEAKTEFTWKERTADKLVVVLHGNQQNNEISREFWEPFDIHGYQIEYLQSSEIDSDGLFRWNDDGDGPEQLAGALNVVKDSSYKITVLAGFSAGCNTILRAISSGDIVADKVVLFSPWMPVLNDSAAETINSLKAANVEVVISCGNDYIDCVPLCRLFEKTAKTMELNCTVRYVEGLGHEYPDDFAALIMI